MITPGGVSATEQNEEPRRPADGTDAGCEKSRRLTVQAARRDSEEKESRWTRSTLCSESIRDPSGEKQPLRLCVCSSEERSGLQTHIWELLMEDGIHVMGLNGITQRVR